MGYLKNEKQHIVYSIIFGFVGSLVGISIFGLSGYMISLSFFEPPVFVIILIIAVIKLFGMIKGAFKYIERLLSHDATFRMIGRLRLKYFTDAVNRSSDTHSVKFIQTLNKHFDQIEDYYIRIIYPYIVALLLMVLLSFAAVAISWYLSLLVVVILTLILILIPKLFESKLYALNHRGDELEASAYMKVYHYMHNFVELFVTHSTAGSRVSITDEFDRLQKYNKTLSKYEAVLEFLAGLIQISAIVVIILFMTENHALLVPMTLLLIISVFDAVSPVMLPAAQYKSVKERVADIDTKNHDATFDEGASIHLENMSYQYPGTVKNAVTNINIRVFRGEKHAIIGSSGSGKTTILNQMTNRMKTGVMPQHLDFYQASLRDNVTMFGHFDVADGHLNMLLSHFELSGFTADTMLDYTGHLSGGEEKRLHMIRLLIEDDDWWLLDEPTARLNTELQQKIWNEILARETVVVSTHDLSRLDQFDVIHYIENGHIAESGSYDELMAGAGHTSQAVERFNDHL